MKEAKDIKMVLRNKNGDMITHTQNFIPFKKMIEWWEIEEKVSLGDIEPGKDVLVTKAKFVASLFDDERVTYESILEDMDSRGFEEYIQNNIYEVMGFSAPSEEEEESGK